MENFLNNLKLKISIDNFLNYLNENFISIIVIIFILVFYKLIRKILLMFFNNFFNKTIKDESFKLFFQSIMNFAVNFFLIYLIIFFLGINLKVIFGFLGAAGLIVGFAFKETINNFLSGFIILTFKPFVIGDVIEFQNTMGTIQKIDVFYTIVKNFQNEIVTVPNSILMNNTVRNFYKNQNRRIEIVVGVGYNSNIEEVKKIIYNILESKKGDFYIIDDNIYKPRVGMRCIAESTLDFDIWVYAKKGKFEDGKNYLWEQIKIEFDKHKIDLPYKILDVFLNKNEEGDK